MQATGPFSPDKGLRCLLGPQQRGPMMRGPGKGGPAPGVA